MRRLVALHGVRSGGRRRAPGDPFSVSDEAAQALIASGAAREDRDAEAEAADPDPADPDPAERAQAIAQAIAGLDATDRTKAGHPKVEAVRAASAIADVTDDEIKAVLATMEPTGGDA